MDLNKRSFSFLGVFVLLFVMTCGVSGRFYDQDKYEMSEMGGEFE